MENGEDLENSTLQSLYESWIQDVYDDIGTFLNWKFALKSEQIPLVTSQSTFQTQIDVSQPTGFYLNQTPLDLVDRSVLVENGVDLSAVGRPRVVFHVGFDSSAQKWIFGIWPIPDSSYTLTVFEYGAPQRLIPSNVIPLPDELLHVLKEGVRVFIYRDDGDYQSVADARRKYNELLLKARQRYRQEIGRTVRLRVSDIPASRSAFIPFPSRFPRI
ncbi:MAG: hypothetical protein QW838_02865 [Candidatus Nitrosotenuis sp.]